MVMNEAIGSELLELVEKVISDLLMFSDPSKVDVLCENLRAAGASIAQFRAQLEEMEYDSKPWFRLFGKTRLKLAAAEAKIECALKVVSQYLDVMNPDLRFLASDVNDALRDTEAP